MIYFKEHNKRSLPKSGGASRWFKKNLMSPNISVLDLETSSEHTAVRTRTRTRMRMMKMRCRYQCSFAVRRYQEIRSLINLAASVPASTTEQEDMFRSWERRDRRRNRTSVFIFPLENLELDKYFISCNIIDKHNYCTVTNTRYDLHCIILS